MRVATWEWGVIMSIAVSNWGGEGGCDHVNKYILQTQNEGCQVGLGGGGVIISINTY